MYLKILALSVFLFFSVCIQAQSTETICNSSGFNLQNSNYLFDISIGEPLTTTLSDANNNFTCGYIQPYITFPNNINLLANSAQIKCFPNPFSTILNIETELNNVNYCLYDMMGRIVFQEKYSKTLQLYFLPNGLYSLVISDINNIRISTFQLFKSN